METGQNSSERFRWSMLAWLALPLLVFWLAIGYLTGRSNVPKWEAENLGDESQVMAIERIEPFTISPLEWQETGLVTIWFDDAWLSQFTVAFPILEKYGLKAALSVPTNFLDFEGYMSSAQIKRLKLEGWEIASHTRSHGCNYDELGHGSLSDELRGSKDDLEKLGLRVENFVTPCGGDTEAVKEVAKQHYLSLRTTVNGLNPLPVNDPYFIKSKVVMPETNTQTVSAWLDEAVAQKAWLVLVFHQVDASKTEYSVTPGMFKEVVSLVNRSGLPVVLPTQALNLVID